MLLVTYLSPSQFSQRPPFLLNEKCLAVSPLFRASSSPPKIFLINDISQETGVPATTIRYWDKVGLISSQRCAKNNYRIFTSKHIQL
ncbi:MerR family DNA-binding transcriptional regulator [Tissierella sp. MSJ-40]|uniref:MerR family DNA-binding transcriptional regulator n=1 Tax=Tissierella simiarum TaxID=2841534 RepID=A0ABS6E9Z2_9FIRM|nr:MerR family DNA-binding transcriptional regulator [Tissierella simiarum]